MGFDTGAAACTAISLEGSKKRRGPGCRCMQPSNAIGEVETWDARSMSAR